MVRGLLCVVFSATEPKTTENSDKQASQKLDHPSWVVLLLHWVQFLTGACAAISTALMCWRSAPGLLLLSSHSAALLCAWFGWAPFSFCQWAQLGWGHPPTTPFPLAASMLAPSAQHHHGFAFLPLFLSLCLVTVFQWKQEGDQWWWQGPSPQRPIPTSSHCGGKMVHFQWGAWFFLPGHARSAGVGGCTITTWPCHLLRPGQEQGHFTSVLPLGEEVVAAGKLPHSLPSPLTSTAGCWRRCSRLCFPQLCGAAPRHQSKQGLDDPTSVPSSSPSCVWNVVAFSCTCHRSGLLEAITSGQPLREQEVKQKWGLALSELRAGPWFRQAWTPARHLVAPVATPWQGLTGATTVTKRMEKTEFVGVVLVDDVELCSMGGAGPVRARGLGGWSTGAAPCLPGLSWGDTH